MLTISVISTKWSAVGDMAFGGRPSFELFSFWKQPRPASWLGI